VENRQKRPAKETAAFSDGVLRLAWFRVNQFSLYVDPWACSRCVFCQDFTNPWSRRLVRGHGPSLGIRFVAAVVLPVVCSLLFATVVAIPIALILLTAFFIMLYWVRIYAISRIGEFILARLRPASSRASAFLLGLFVYYLLAIIPFIGWLVVPLVMLFGFGAELIARKQLYTTARTQGLI
jgi:hypothetical protein